MDRRTAAWAFNASYRVSLKLELFPWGLKTDEASHAQALSYQRPWSRARFLSKAAALFRAMRAFCSPVRPPPPEAFAGRGASAAALP